MSYQFEVFYREGRKLNNADSLSRMTHAEKAKEDACLPNEMKVSALVLEHEQTQLMALLKEAEFGARGRLARLVNEQRQDELLWAIRNSVNGGDNPEGVDRVAKLGIELHKFHIDRNDLLFYSDTPDRGESRKVRHRIAVPKTCVPVLLKAYHDDVQGGHLGSEKLIYALSARYYWPGMYQQVVHYVDSCKLCQSFKLGKAIGKTRVGEIPEPNFNELVVVDVCGPLKPTSMDNIYILCIIEYTTRFVRFVPMKNCTAAMVAKAFYDQWICLFGPPGSINSDRGPAFVSVLMRELCQFLDIQQRFSCPYVARSHGIIERVQLTLQKALGFYLSQYENDWDVPLQSIGHALNSTPNKSTGFSANLLSSAEKLVRWWMDLLRFHLTVENRLGNSFRILC